MKLHCKLPYARITCGPACRLDLRVIKLVNAKLRSLPIGKKVSDGGGLYYQPPDTNKGKWSFRFAINGRSHEMGLGTYPEISIKEARLAHAEQRGCQEVFAVLDAMVKQSR